MIADAWRDKIVSTVITIALTALGATSFQSLKYVFVDYGTSAKASEEAYKATVAAQEQFFREWKTFDKLAPHLDKGRTRERHELLMKAQDYLTKNRIKEVKVSD